MLEALPKTILKISSYLEEMIDRSPLGWLALTLTLLFATLLTLYPATTVSFQIEGNGEFQIFYDDGAGFRESKSLRHGNGIVRLSESGYGVRAFRVDPPPSGLFIICSPNRTRHFFPRVDRSAPIEPTVLAELGMKRVSESSHCTTWQVEADHPDPQVAFGLPASPRTRALSHLLFLARFFFWASFFFAAFGIVRRITPAGRKRIMGFAEAAYIQTDRQLPVLFLVLASALGLGFIVVRPPGSVPDEFAHANKIALMASGQWTGVDGGDERPPLLAQYGPFHSVHGRKFTHEELVTVADAPLACENAPREGAAAPGSASPLMYLSPWASHSATCQINGSFGHYYYAAQIGNLLLYLLLCFVGLKAAGFGRWVLFVVASIPMSLYLATALSYDGNMLGLCIAYLGVVSGIASGRLSLVWAQWLLLGLGVLIAFSKPLMGWIFFAPWLCLAVIESGWAQRVRWLLATSLVPAALHAFWLYRIAGSGENRARPDVPSVNGMDMLLASPFSYLQALVNTAFSDTGRFVLKSAVGVFGWLDVYPPSHFYAIAAMAIVGAVSLNPSAKPSGLRIALFAWLVAAVVVIVVCIPFYVYWTTPGSSVIEGLQGRYFIPLIAFVAMCSSFRMHRAWQGAVAVAIVASVPVMSIISIASIFHRYYL